MKGWILRLFLMILIIIIAFLVWMIYQLNTQKIPRSTEPTDITKPAPTTKDKRSPAQPPASSEKPLDNALISGRIEPSTDARFALIPVEYSSKDIYLQKQAYDALIKMITDAQADGVNLRVVSGFRSYKDQMLIWQRKWQANIANNTDEIERAKQILRYSSFPGISRHHWGTDLDLNSVELAYWRTPEGVKISDWLRTHASNYGYCSPYSGKQIGQRVGGYEDEPWHWSYKPLAKSLQIARSKSLDIALAQPIVGQEAISQIPDQIRAYVDSVSASCQ